MHDATPTRPLARRDRDDRLRAAAALLEHLASNEVPADEVPTVEAGVVTLLKRAGMEV